MDSDLRQIIELIDALVHRTDATHHLLSEIIDKLSSIDGHLSSIEISVM